MVNLFIPIQMEQVENLSKWPWRLRQGEYTVFHRWPDYCKYLEDLDPDAVPDCFVLTAHIQMPDGTPLPPNRIDSEEINMIAAAHDRFRFAIRSEGFWDRFFDFDFAKQREAIGNLTMAEVPPQHVRRFVEWAKKNEDYILIKQPNHPGCVTEFLQNFDQHLKDASIEEADQFVWAYLGMPCWVSSIWLEDPDASPGWVALVEAMVHPFADYLARQPDAENQNGFHMWFDLFLSGENVGPLAESYLRVLKQVLYLPNIACQGAALHGLNHLVHPDRGAVIAEWLNNPVASKELEDYARSCAEGKCM